MYRVNQAAASLGLRVHGTSASRNPRTGVGSRIKVPYPIPRDVTPSGKRWGGATTRVSGGGGRVPGTGLKRNLAVHCTRRVSQCHIASPLHCTVKLRTHVGGRECLIS